MANIAGIRFKKAGKIYYFDAGEIALAAGDYAVVKTSRGMELGHVVIAPGQIEVNETGESLSPVVRKAEPDDIAKEEELNTRAEEALIECGKIIAELNLPMKLLSAEYSLDSSRLTFLFSAEERVDFRELVRRLSGKFKVRVELRQVGSRDEAKLLGSYGRCGRELCCGSFLTEFTPVSIKMAKEQDLPLNPMKISGACGRLMCCLAYEGEQYRLMKEKMPKVGQRVSTKMGEATVVGGNPLKETVVVELDSEATAELPLDEVSY
ncbi:MAG: stage 0 sporulation family protein [Chloroflexi bacterium RBG_13_51_18]|nr:MAG: stage 0 sporulation family protein [Chloroflexi bacterium RBG_13_51_18]